MNSTLSLFACFLCMPVLAYAIDAPPPVCEVVEVPSKKVTIHARHFLKDGRVAPLRMMLEDGSKYVGSITLTLTNDLGRWNLPAGPKYEEVRVSPEGAPGRVLYRPVCVDVVWAP